MIEYIGLDFETSGTDPWGKHVPIQIGLYSDKLQFQSYIGGWDWKEYEWSLEAEKVHQKPKELIQIAPPIWVVDIMAARAVIYSHGYSNRMFTVPVGFNVAGFDRQFITRWMPNLNRLISYRTVDLNAILFFQSDNEKEYKNRKAKLNELVKASLHDFVEHDAYDDARKAYYIWNEMKRKEL